MKILAIVLLLGFAAFSIRLKTELMTPNDSLEKFKSGEILPDFTLKDSDGKEYTLGKVAAEHKLVAINFWATWCGPCRAEMPTLERIYTEENGKGFVLLAINEDDGADDLKAYLQARKFTFPVLLDPNQEVLRQFGVDAFPTTVLVDKERRVVQVIRGASPTFEFLVKGFVESDGAVSSVSEVHSITVGK